jgi:hypothetical protein
MVGMILPKNVIEIFNKDVHSEDLFVIYTDLYDRLLNTTLNCK